MNILLKVGFGIAVILSSAIGANAQSKGKFGHINSQELLLLMPESKEAEVKMQDERKTLEQQLQSMSAEYQSKLQEYEANAAAMSELVKQTKAKEITDLQGRIQSFQQSANEELQKKEAELLQPIINKAKEAIKGVAEKSGYAYVFDSSLGVLVHAPDGDDILPLVKKQLGIQ